MKFDMTKPCTDCPFRKEGGIRLTIGRIRQIGGAVLSAQGGTFACHKTTGVASNHKPDQESHCAGALIFMERHNPAGTQAARIAERLGMYDRRRLVQSEFPNIWDSLRQWMKSALPASRKNKVKPR